MAPCKPCDPNQVPLFPGGPCSNAGPPLVTPILPPAPIPAGAPPYFRRIRLKDFLAEFDQAFFVGAMMARASYSPTNSWLSAILNAVFGTAGTLSYVANSDQITPGVASAQLPEFNVIVVSGTTSQIQWSAQIASAALGVFTTGDFQTLAPWTVAAEAIWAELPVLVTAGTQPTLIIGHSFGGALACLLAAKFQNLAEPPPMSVWTYGAPKAGDGGLAEKLFLIDGIRMVNVGDFVPYVPPFVSPLAAGLSPAAALILTKCNHFIHPFGGRLYGGAGFVDFLSDVQNGQAPWQSVMNAVLNGTPAAIGQDHPAANYCTTIRSAFVTFPDGLRSRWANPGALDSINAGMAAAGL